MSSVIRRASWSLALLALLLAAVLPLRIRAAVMAFGGQEAAVKPDLYSGLKWRNIGPFHGGRISAVTGVIGQAGTFYVGTPNGGVWKTTSAGVTWVPIIDQVTNINSIGAVVVAPSDPNIIYVGSGDPIAGGDGDGVYKSTDAGKTWTHIGLEATHRISKMVIDPKDPNLVLAGAVGDGSNGEAGGVYRTTDGGRTWEKVLTPTGATAVRDLGYDYSTPALMFATTLGTGGGFGVGGGRAANAPPPVPAKLFKSTDEGKTWTEVKTLPQYNGRVSVAVAMHTNGQRLFVVGAPANGESGLFRSDDGGATWKHMAGNDTRVANGQGNYQSGVFVDPQNPDIVYVTSIALMRSTDGGNTFIPFKGAPGGEDYHMMWIDPTNGQRILLGVDQGANVSLDGGKTWSLFYVIPLAQMYHVSTDTRYPYWVLGAQQDTGAVMTRSRGDFGQVNFFADWSPLPSSEFGTLTADPLHPEIIYGVGYGPGGGGSGMVKINMATGQWQNVAPNFGADSTKYRQVRDFWKKFDPFDQHAMYVGYQCLLVTRDGAATWKAVSPDLTMGKDEKPEACGTPVPPPPINTAGRGAFAINDFFLSAKQKGVIWTVSNNAQFYRTSDAGLHWTNVSNITDPPAGTMFGTLDGGHHDATTAYVSGRVTAGRGGTPAGVDPNVPLVWRTHDSGTTWTKIVTGLPKDERTGSWVNVVREDPRQKGLIFCGTETTVYVSFDDGDHWRSLRNNLPSISVRDLVFHSDDHMNDIVIGTYGRGFWVLDDMTPLREIAAKAGEIAGAPAHFFKPGDAIRSRININWDQPTSVEMPHAPNPPYGAIFYYHLGRPASGEIKLEISDAAGGHVRSMSSNPPPPIEGVNYPDYWVAPPAARALPTAAGMNRASWDLRYDDPPAFQHDLQNQMNMVEGITTAGPHGPQVPPGTYTMKLSVDGKTYTQTVVLHNDPRVGDSPATMAALQSQHKLTQLAYKAMKETFAANEEVAAVRAQVTPLTQSSNADVAAKAKELDTKLATFGGAVQGGGRGGGGGFGGGRGGAATPGAMQSFIQLNNSFGTMVSMMQVGLDIPPTPAQINTWESNCKNYNTTVAAWKAQAEDLSALPGLNVTPTKLTAAVCGFVPSAPVRAPARR